MYCTNIRETSEHFLTQCTKLDNARVQCFNKKKITMKEIINNYPPSNIIDYIKDSNRFLEGMKMNNNANKTEPEGKFAGSVRYPPTG